MTKKSHAAFRSPRGVFPPVRIRNPLSRRHTTMPSYGASQKKTTAKKTSTASPAAAKKTTAKKATPPKPRAGATVRAVPAPAHTPGPAMVDDSAMVDRRFMDLLAARRKRRQLIALKVACYALVVGFLASLGLAIWQLTIPSMFAGVYVALAGVFATATGICATLYHQRRKNEGGDGDD
ncbi:hypothetical protein [Streptomyces sp. NPDC057412]|uniref:hypothetical protein n=1 Tax=Streptomyces sp. NPDC057412 TaxID=3346123 RepID=UPI003696F26E